MLRPSQYPEAALTLARTFGARGVLLRAGHEVRKAAGQFRRRPVHSTDAVAWDRQTLFAVDPERLAASTSRGLAIERAERVLDGEFQAHRANWRPLPATSTDWLRHPFTGRVREEVAPWWKVPHLDPEFGDIKELWEPARFAWVYDLVRAYLITGEDRFAARFHQVVETWSESSPAFCGPHWSCGQEAAIRASALLYAEANLGTAPSSSPAVMARLRTILAASGERIADAIGYAISQRNNHAISEAAGLVMLGTRFHGQHPEAEKWLKRGLAWLERSVEEQFATDGWYIQHSFVYQRLALDQCVLAEQSLRSTGRGLSDRAVARLRSAADLLTTVMDANTGRVPNHGASDGAFVHPITLADYRDFRPVLTAVCALYSHPFPAGTSFDREVLAWLSAEPPSTAPPQMGHVVTGSSGWAAAHVGDSRVFLRAGKYSSRPGHLDPLHLDVRIDGREVIVDAGTFSYNSAPPWHNGLMTAHVHNGPILDGREPGVRGPRFLWYVWPRADVLSVHRMEDHASIVAEVPGSHRRTVRVYHDRVQVEDKVLAADTREVRVSWLLHPEVDPSCVQVSEGRQVLKASEGATKGWFSPRYGEKIVSHAVEALSSTGNTDIIVTEIYGGS